MTASEIKTALEGAIETIRLASEGEMLEWNETTKSLTASCFGELQRMSDRIRALSEENESLKGRLKELEKENKRLNSTVDVMKDRAKRNVDLRRSLSNKLYFLEKKTIPRLYQMLDKAKTEGGKVKDEKKNECEARLKAKRDADRYLREGKKLSQNPVAVLRAQIEICKEHERKGDCKGCPWCMKNGACILDTRIPPSEWVMGAFVHISRELKEVD